MPAVPGLVLSEAAADTRKPGLTIGVARSAVVLPLVVVVLVVAFVGRVFRLVSALGKVVWSCSLRHRPALQGSPIPPAPRGSRISYGPRRVPADSAMQPPSREWCYGLDTTVASAWLPARAGCV